MLFAIQIIKFGLHEFARVLHRLIKDGRAEGLQKEVQRFTCLKRTEALIKLISKPCLQLTDKPLTSRLVKFQPRHA